MWTSMFAIYYGDLSNISEIGLYVLRMLIFQGHSHNEIFWEVFMVSIAFS